MNEPEFDIIEGDIITLALNKKFDVIAHGCNCFCTMGAGLAPQMARAFDCDIFKMESPQFRGDINKLGTIDYNYFKVTDDFKAELTDGIEPYDFIVVNAYTQYGFGLNHKEGSARPLDYEALMLCFRKMNHLFEGKHIGLPLIGAGLAGGDSEIIKQIMRDEFTSCDLTLVLYKPNLQKQ